MTVPGYGSPAMEEFAFALEDQYGVLHTQQAVGADLMILIGGDRSASKRSREWAEVLQGLTDTHAEAQRAVAIVRVADLRGIPAAFRPIVARQLRQRYRSPILMDWEGVLVGRFAFVSRSTNVVIVDHTGDELLRIRAEEPTASEIEAIARALREWSASRRPSDGGRLLEIFGSDL